MLCCRQWSWADSSVAFVKNTCSEIPIAYSMMASFKKTKYEKKSSLIHHILTSPSDMPLCWLCWDISHVSSPCSLQSHVWGSSDVSLPFYLFLKGVKHPSFFTYFFSFLKNCHKYPISHTCSIPEAQGGLPHLCAFSVSCAGAGVMYTGNVGEEQPSIKGEHFQSCSEPDQEQTEAWKQLEETLRAKCPKQQVLWSSKQAHSPVLQKLSRESRFTSSRINV